MFQYLVLATLLQAGVLSAHDHHHHDDDHHQSDCGGAGLPSDVDPVSVVYTEPASSPSAAAASSSTRRLTTAPSPIRITIQHNLIDATDDAFTCYTVGQMVDPCKGRWSRSSCPDKECTEKDIVDTAKKKIAKRRIEWASNYVMSTFSVVAPRTTNIDTSTMSLSSGYAHYTSTKYNVANTDLIIITTLRKHDNDYVAGFAGCVGQSSDSRCILGYFNYCPRIFDVLTSNSPDVIEKERRTAVHEILHVLGAVKLSGFLNGGYLAQSETTYLVKENKHLDKKVVHVRTPKVLQVWREQTGCKDNEDDGPTLEDLPMGVGAHWEARQTGSIVMSYGTLSSEVYLSDLTLAFLEDTGHYIANYSNAGRLVQPSTNTITDEVAIFASTPPIVTSEMANKNKMIYSPGHLRWGRGEGCSFYSSKTTDWPKEYLCTKNNAGSCTPDHRMAAICRLVTYGAKGLAVPVYSKTAKTSTFVDAEAYADTCWRDGSKTYCRKSTGGYPTIPEQVRPEGQASDGTIGGWNSAMDFALIPAGYWNCQDQQPASSSSNFAEGGNAGFNMGDLVSTAQKAMLKYGGQTRCPNCRCFRSSLREFNLGIDFTKFGSGNHLGLCYRSNCPTPNNLQIGVKSTFGTYWYDCPAKGGELYIAGFSGSILCPNATEFCRTEEITLLYNPATSLIMEWIVLGLMIVVREIIEIIDVLFFFIHNKLLPLNSALTLLIII